MKNNMKNNMKTNMKKIITKLSLCTMLLGGVGVNTYMDSGIEAQASTSYYKVVKGDTLTSIAKKKKTTVKKIKQLNNLKSNLIKVGQKLKYKGTVTKQTKKVKIKKLSNENSNSYLNEGRKYLGTPYVWGGTTSRGLDCSGFVYRTLKDSGKNVSRLTSGGLYAKYKHISKSNLEAGDLIFFSEGRGITHVAFYYGNGKILHSAGSKVQINNLDNGYWKQRVVGYATID